MIVFLSQQLTQTYGKGWGERQLRHCLQFAKTFPDREIVNTLCSKLTWSHLRILSGVDAPTVLPPKELLQAKPHEAIASARRRLQSSPDEPSWRSQTPDELID